MTTSLDSLPFKTPALITSLAEGEHALALMQLGLVPGARVEVIRQAPLGCPLEVDVTGARLAIRRVVAATVLVERVSVGGST